MSTLSLFEVEFQVVKAAAAPKVGQGGAAFQYRREVRKATVSAASGHPKEILAVLNADVSVLSGETIDILATRPLPSAGTEGSVLS